MVTRKKTDRLRLKSKAKFLPPKKANKGKGVRLTLRSIAKFIPAKKARKGASLRLRQKLTTKSKPFPPPEPIEDDGDDMGLQDRVNWRIEGEAPTPTKPDTWQPFLTKYVVNPATRNTDGAVLTGVYTVMAGIDVDPPTTPEEAKEKLRGLLGGTKTLEALERVWAGATTR